MLSIQRYFITASFEALAFVSIITAVAKAETTALDFQSNAGSDFQQGSYSLGWRFTANQTISVTSLGFYDDDGNGLTQNHDVGIFDANTCQVIVQGTVSPTDTLIGLFRYRSVSPATLTAGKTYLIAAVTKNEDYRINVNPLNVDPAITFGGFTIFGNTQNTTTLQCPNGTSEPGTNGDFGPTFRFEPGAASPTPTPDDSSKRDSAITLFCNRIGVNLETAKCTATVADQGAPPRAFPEGSVEFSASDGFFPASGSCALIPTALSPGISSCEGEFAIPFGFPIGKKFPIEALYTGSTELKVSATSHELIVAACVGTTKNPCSGAVALNFPGVPELIDNVIAAILECGPTTAANTLSQRAGDDPESGDQCRGELQAEVELGEAFADLTYEQWKALEATISAALAKKDPLSGAIKEVGSQLKPEQYNTWHASSSRPVTAAAVGSAIWQKYDKISNRINRGDSGPSKHLKDLLRLRSMRTSAAKARVRKVFLLFSERKVSAQNNSLARVDLQMRKRAKKIIASLKAIGATNIPITLTVKATRKKAKFNSKQKIEVGIR